MMRDEFQDAMNLIADDLIEEVDALRVRKKRRVQAVRYLSMAACVCLIMGSVFVWTQTNSKFKQDGAMKEKAQDSGTTYPVDEGQDIEDSSNFSGDGLENLYEDSAIGTEDENKPQSSKLLLKVDQLTEDGFIGSVTEDDNFAIGTKLIVYVAQGEYVEYKVGDILEVEYDKEGSLDADIESSRDQSSMGSTTDLTIYAERIRLIEGRETD